MPAWQRMQPQRTSLSFVYPSGLAAILIQTRGLPLSSLKFARPACRPYPCPVIDAHCQRTRELSKNENPRQALSYSTHRACVHTYFSTDTFDDIDIVYDR